MAPLSIAPRSQGRYGEWVLALLAIACMHGLLLLEVLRH
jgi:hypothetical protein